MDTSVSTSHNSHPNVVSSLIQHLTQGTPSHKLYRLSIDDEIFTYTHMAEGFNMMLGEVGKHMETIDFNILPGRLSMAAQGQPYFSFSASK